MKEHEQRAIDEAADLRIKCEKLYAFFGTHTFQQLDREDKRLMKGQHHCMLNYLEFLKRRIARFNQVGGQDEQN